MWLSLRQAARSNTAAVLRLHAPLKNAASYLGGSPISLRGYSSCGVLPLWAKAWHARRAFGTRGSLLQESKNSVNEEKHGRVLAPDPHKDPSSRLPASMHPGDTHKSSSDKVKPARAEAGTAASPGALQSAVGQADSTGSLASGHPAVVEKPGHSGEAAAGTQGPTTPAANRSIFGRQILNSETRMLRSLMVTLWPKNKPSFKLRVIVAVLLLVGLKILTVQVPFFFKAIVDEMNVDWATQAGTVATVIGLMVLAYGGARFGAVLFGELRSAVFALVAQLAIKRVANNTFKHLLNMDLHFHLSSQTGGLTRAIERGTKGISYVLSAMVFHIIPISVEIGIVCSLLTYNYGVSFAAVTFLTMAAYLVFTIKTTAWRTHFRRQANNADNEAASVALDSLTNYEAVKYFNNESYQCSKYDASLTNYQNASIKVATSLAYLNAGQNFIFTLALTAMMYMGCHGVATGALSVGDLVLINQLVFQLLVPLNFLGSVYRELKQSLLDMENLFQLQNHEVLIRDKPGVLPLKLDAARPGTITFENVSFGYHPDRLILKNASFTIPPGEKVAIVGPSGLGKSTILKLVFRFYDVSLGRILIDGQDISKVSLESLRKAIGVVPQDTPLFNDTIKENIRYGRLDASDEEVMTAVQKVSLKPLMADLPLGLETIVGERGLMISGGEKQRLAIARLLLKKAPITFFDEATSALDTHTEQALLRTLRQVFTESRSTNVLIAHRLRTIADSDKIIVLNKGKVQEEGTHQELLDKRDSLYADLWNIQENLNAEEENKGAADTQAPQKARV